MREKPIDHTVAFPAAIGTENERGLLLDTIWDKGEPYTFVMNFRDYVPEGSIALDLGDRIITQNSSKIYIGGTSDPTPVGVRTNLEQATPECGSPKELTAHIKANRDLFQVMVGNHLREASKLGKPAKGRVQMRVVDWQGSRKACHDSFNIVDGTYLRPESSQIFVSNPLLRHIATAALITGAMVVEEDGWRYGQKIDGLVDVNKYAYGGSMYAPRSFKRDSKMYAERFEVRCNDDNISDWAIQQRVGGMALLMAILQTPLRTKIHAVKNMTDGALLNYAKQINVMHIDKHGQLHATPDQMEAIDFHMLNAELALDKLPDVLDEIPDEYTHIAKERYEFCEDYKKVVAGEADMSLLADRADWAAKAIKVLKHIDRDRSFDIKRTLTDFDARGCDMAYDYIGYKAEDGVVKPPIYGYGHRQRAKGGFRDTVSTIAVDRARKRAPTSTRAHARQQVIDNFFVRNWSWTQLDVVGEEDSQTTLKITLGEPGQTHLSTHDIWYLQTYGKVKPGHSREDFGRSA